MSEASNILDGVSAVATEVENSPLEGALPAYAKLAVDLAAHVNALDGWLNELISLFPTHARPAPPPAPPAVPAVK